MFIYIYYSFMNSKSKVLQKYYQQTNQISNFEQCQSIQDLQQEIILYNVISTLMVRIVKFYKSQKIDQKAFKKIMKQQHKILFKMENHKYLDPKYAELLEHFMKVLQKNMDENENDHMHFQLRRKSIEQNSPFNRTLSVLGKEINQLKNFSDKIDTLEFDELNSEKDLQRIPQRIQQKRHKQKKKSKKSRNASLKSNIDIWDMRRQRLPQIPNLQPIQQTIMNRTRFNSSTTMHINHQISDKLTNRTMDQPGRIEKDHSNNKILAKPPKFRAKMFFK